MIKGIGVVEGIVIGRAFVKHEAEMEISYIKIKDFEDEIQRFNLASERCRINLERKYNKTLNILGKEEAEIYRRHLRVFDSSILLGQVRKEIEEQKNNAEYILFEVMKKYASMYDRVEDEFLKKKSQSIRYIAEQVIKELIGIDFTGLAEINGPVIIFAKDLDSNDVVHLDKSQILAIVTEVGGKDAYSALVATNLNIPAVGDVKSILKQVKTDDEVIIDGTSGEVIINPDREIKEQYLKKINRAKELEGLYQAYIDKETRTIDGYEFALSAVVGHTNTVKRIISDGAEDIGIFKTEFLFFGRDDMPTEKTQVEAYQEALTLASGKEISFRVLEANSDSNLPYIYFHKERNVDMGRRSIRLLLSERELFRTQIRALLRVSNFGPIQVIFPMITSIEELLDIKLVLEEAKVELDELGESYNDHVKLGMMIEAPVTAMSADVFAREVDFIVIGSSELVRFMTVADPSNEAVADRYDIFHPGVLRMVRHIVMLSHREGTKVSIVGEIADSEYLLPFLIAIGIDKISIKSGMIAKARWITSNVSKSIWEEEIDVILNMSSGSEVKHYLEKRYSEEVIWKED